LARAALIPWGMRLNPNAPGRGKAPHFFSKKQPEKGILYSIDNQLLIIIQGITEKQYLHRT
jgi:hypothetical protein